MNALGVKKVQMCPFEDTAPVTHCCSPKGTVTAFFFGECNFSTYVYHPITHNPKHNSVSCRV